MTLSHPEIIPGIPVQAPAKIAGDLNLENYFE